MRESKKQKGKLKEEFALVEECDRFSDSISSMFDQMIERAAASSDQGADARILSSAGNCADPRAKRSRSGYGQNHIPG